MAQEVGLDLVEISPTATPPVCKIMDYGKHKYDLSKKEHKAKTHSHQTELNEVRIKTPKIGIHDLLIKVERARTFLLRGDRVQFSLRFRGRELAHIDEGLKVFDRVKEELVDCATVDASRREGRRITMMLAPTKPPEKPQKAPKQPKPKAAKPVFETPGASGGDVVLPPDALKAVAPNAAVAPQATEAPKAPVAQAPPATEAPKAPVAQETKPATEAPQPPAEA